MACFHCAALRRITTPDRSAATNTPVPAAESQLMTKRAASGLAFGATTGGIRCTRLWRAGMSQAGSERLPANVDPSSVVLKVIPEKRLLRVVFQAGMPQIPQQTIRSAHGSHAYAVCPTEYG